ncbi:ubiquitin-conjugating enzyme [Rickenella mellea]|uniref:E2 ubiquitin-conjugating enzyme n=1 Tax=Rickenella mellea TaxID=50990 RepID=A0A4Y7QL72_9AGAM|nr:ubiquitin-conjugating enzyme [Rickenella mellea]
MATPSPIAVRRIQRELSDITKNPIPGISAYPVDDDLLRWDGKVVGSSDSPYKGGSFKFEMTFPPEFPFKAPAVKFTTRIYHPGINEEGSICVPILRDEWKPTVSIATVLSVIQEKVNNPSPDDPYEPEIAAQLKSEEAKFMATAKEWTKKYAS